MKQNYNDNHTIFHIPLLDCIRWQGMEMMLLKHPGKIVLSLPRNLTISMPRSPLIGDREVKRPNPSMCAIEWKGTVVITAATFIWQKLKNIRQSLTKLVAGIFVPLRMHVREIQWQKMK